MTATEIIDELESLGSERTRKTYLNHGIAEHCFGVSYADMEKIRKRIKRDHALAEELWNSGQHEARVLATMIADPAMLDAKALDAWFDGLQGHVLVDAFAGLAAKSPAARAKMEKWIAREGEWTGRCGWRILGELALHDPSLPDEYFEPYLATIAGEIHGKRNRVREAMNTTLIAIGGRNPTLRKRALDVAAHIGVVEVDHGKTSCKTPDATAYILKAAARRAETEQKKKPAATKA